MIGKKLGNWVIDSLIGRGAMGNVYRAQHCEIGRPVALKTLNADLAGHPMMDGRMKKEALASVRVQHENIVEVLDFGRDGDQVFLVMELLTGRTLGEALAEAGGRMPLARTVHILEQVAEALAAAHGSEIVHRDLKPDNIFLVRRAKDPDYVKVLDFGIAQLRVDGMAATVYGTIMGTPLYMSPEQAAPGLPGAHAKPLPVVDASTDVYALGVIAFQMLSGRLPFLYNSPPDMLHAHVNEVAPRLQTVAPDVPVSIDRLIERALAKAKTARPTMAEFGALLAGAPSPALQPKPSTAPAPGAPPQPQAAHKDAFAETEPPSPAGSGRMAAQKPAKPQPLGSNPELAPPKLPLPSPRDPLDYFDTFVELDDAEKPTHDDTIRENMPFAKVRELGRAEPVEQVADDFMKTQPRFKREPAPASPAAPIKRKPLELVADGTATVAQIDDDTFTIKCGRCQRPSNLEVVDFWRKATRQKDNTMLLDLICLGCGQKMKLRN